MTSKLNEKLIVKECVKERGWKLTQLADAIGVPKQRINSFLNRDGIGLRIDSFVNMIEALGYEIQIVDKYNKKAEPKVLTYIEIDDGDES